MMPSCWWIVVVSCLIGCVSCAFQKGVTTEVVGRLGRGNPSQNHAPTLEHVISHIDFKFSPTNGLIYMGWEYRQYIRRGLGSVWADSLNEYLQFGCKGCTEPIDTIKFTPDEFPIEFTPCLNDANQITFVRIRVKNNGGAYLWTAGNISTCTFPITSQFLSKPSGVVSPIVDFGLTYDEIAIYSLNLTYLTCVSECLTEFFYQRPCDRNGRCDPMLNCTSDRGLSVCSLCPQGFTYILGRCIVDRIPPSYQPQPVDMLNPDVGRVGAGIISYQKSPPWQLAGIYGAMAPINEGFVRDPTYPRNILTSIALVYYQLDHGTYKTDTKDVFIENGTIHNPTEDVFYIVDFAALEYITQIEFCHILWNTGKMITYMKLTTQLNNSYEIGSVAHCSPFVNASLTIPTDGGRKKFPEEQRVVGLIGWKNITIDGFNFYTANCTGDCDVFYGSGDCAVNNGGCNASAKCTETEFGRNCMCTDGWEGNGTICTKINPCLNMSSTLCAPEAACSSFANIPVGASYGCSSCRFGLAGSGYTQCIDYNTCLQAPACNTSETCVYSEKQRFCIPNPENGCESDNGGCDYRVSCTPLEGGAVQCGPCPNGTYQSYNGSIHACIKHCGDGMCNATFSEDCFSCPKDCNDTLCVLCGDLRCEGTETCQSCPSDCPCETSCRPTCSQNGRCVGGRCICSNSWSGPSCSTPPQPIIIEAPETEPNITIETPGTSGPNSPAFSVSIRSISEFSAGGTLVRSVGIPTVTFARNISVFGNNNTAYTYNATVFGGTVLTVVVTQFAEAQEVYFANVTQNFGANMLKIAVSIKNWPFKSLTDTLHVTLDSRAQKAVQCQNSLQESGSVQWFTIVVDNVTLYAELIDRAIIDDRVRSITYTLNDTDHSITAILPHFWDSADMDPNYSVLLGDEDSCTKKVKADDNTRRLLIIILPIVVGVILLIALLVIVAPRLRTRYKVYRERKSHKFENQLSEISNSTEPEMEMKIEKASDMEVYTASGRYHVPM